MLVRISVMTNQHLRQRLHSLSFQLQDSEIEKLAEDQDFIQFFEQARSYQFVNIATQDGSKRAIQLNSYNNVVKYFMLK